MSGIEFPSNQERWAYLEKTIGDLAEVFAGRISPEVASFLNANEFGLALDELAAEVMGRPL